MPTISVRRFTSRFRRSNGLVEYSRVQCSDGKVIYARISVSASASTLAAFGQRPSSALLDLLELLACCWPVGLSEDGANSSGHHRFVTLRHMRKEVAQTMHPAPLPTRSLKDSPNRGFQSGMRIGNDQLDAL